MKVATLDHIDESTGRLSKSALPKLTYSEALDLVVTLPGGAVRSVRACTVEEMQALVQACVTTATNKKGCAAALVGLDYADPLSKWYALLELCLHGCTLPLAEKQRQTAENTV
jgi:hypothetical protein